MQNRIIHIVITFILISLPCAALARIEVDINSGDPSCPFPRFNAYHNNTGRLGNLATHNAAGVSHAEMEKTIRDAYQIMMNRAEKPGGGMGGVDYIYYRSNPSCSEGDGYAMLAAVSMADKSTFDGLWLWVHDFAMNKVKRYSDCKESSPGYLYSQLPGWTNEAGDNSAADGDFDIALALLCAYRQWGEFMGIDDACGNPISYKQAAIDFIKALTDTLIFSSNGSTYLSGDIGFDGYFKGGDSWLELTDWANDVARSGVNIELKGPQEQWFDYIAPSYFHQFGDFFSEMNTASYAWNIKQFRRAEASSDWLMGQMLKNPTVIPFAGRVSIDSNNVPTFRNSNMGEDFRLPWRTVLNYVWHGNPSSSWDPVTHQVINGTPNTFQRDIGQRYARFLWDNRQAPWGNSCVYGADKKFSYWGPQVLWTNWTLNGTDGGFFFQNWIHGTGSPSAVAAQDFNLMAEMYRQCEIEWDVDTPGDKYLTSVPHYFHGWFRLLGLLLLSGNYDAPMSMEPSANLKVYLDVDKTCAVSGEEITYTISWRNYGSLDAEDVVIVDTLHSDMSFVSCTDGGSFNASNRVVTWDIGTVPGFKTSSGTAATTGEVSLVVKIDKPTEKQYANRASILCSNGTGWTSNEYPNRISSIMKRNLIDIVSQGSNEKSGVSPLHGGRPGVHFSFFRHDEAPSAPQQTMTIRMFHDAQEAYIGYGNYRVSYFLFDTERDGLAGQNGNTDGWIVQPIITEGVGRFSVSHQNLSPGSDSYGKWNQRIMIQFSDTIPQDTNWSNMTTTSHHLVEYLGNPSRVHRGSLYPMRVEWSISPADWKDRQWDNDRSWSSTAVSSESDFAGFPVSPDFTDTDPDNKGIAVNSLNPKGCETVEVNVENILVEEWDGYSWRRIFGQPLADPVSNHNIRNYQSKDISFQVRKDGVIRYTLPVPGKTQLQVLDMQGRVRAVLENSFKNAGTYSVKWNRKKNGSNIYIFKLVSGNRSVTRRHIFVN
ncbi:MAG: DUF11 domain-containing protein [Fibrobacter sp.]|nr:DUF11 domain-containing protein [Fibrobacter sp.]